MIKIKLLFSIGVILQYAQAAMYNKHEAVGMGCALAAQPLFPNCKSQNYGCFCNNPKFVQSVSKCIRDETNHNSTDMGASFDKFSMKFCEIHNIELQGQSVFDTIPLDTPTVDHNTYLKAHQAEENNMTQKEVSLWLGLGLIFYWVLIVGFTFLWYFSKYIGYRFLAHSFVLHRLTLMQRIYRQYIMWPSTWTHKHLSRVEFFKGILSFSIPLRHEFILVLGYSILALIFMLTPYDIMDGDILFPTKWKQIMRYSSDRAGILATVQFPMLCLFATKSNLLIYLTRWSYMKYNVFHRAIAIVTFLLLVVHAVLKHIFSKSYGSSLSKYYYPLPYFRWGCAAIGLMSLMIATAPFRSRFYEIFYRLHQSLAFCTLICSIYHLNNLPFKTPLYIAYAIWGSDWIVRIFRIFFFNFNFVFPPLAGSRRLSFATARVYSNDMIALSVRAPVRWISAPGQYVYLHLSRFCFIGGHPFSVVGPTADGEGLKLLICPRKGATQRLLKELKAKQCTVKNPVSISVYVEGPYGITAPVHRYDDGLFFCGGIGITGILAYLDRMAQRDNRVLPRRVILFWAIRNREDIAPVRSHILQLNLREGVEIKIFCRDHDAEPMLNSSTSSKEQAIVTMQSASSGSGSSEQQSTTTDQSLTAANGSNGSNSSNSSNSLDNNNRAEKVSGRVDASKVYLGYNENQEYASANARDSEAYRGTRYSRHSRQSANQMTSGETEAGKLSRMQSMSGAARKHLSKLSAVVTAENSENDPCDYGIDSAQKARSEEEDQSFVATMRYRSSSDTIDDLIDPVAMDIPVLLKHYFKLANGSVCIVGCGPDRMMDTLRWSCSKFLPYARFGSVDYYEEAQRW